MPCKCTCGRDIDCGDTLCPICEEAATLLSATLGTDIPPGMKPDDYQD